MKTFLLALLDRFTVSISTYHKRHCECTGTSQLTEALYSFEIGFAQPEAYAELGCLMLNKFNHNVE